MALGPGRRAGERHPLPSRRAGTVPDRSALVGAPLHDFQDSQFFQAVKGAGNAPASWFYPERLPDQYGRAHPSRHAC